MDQNFFFRWVWRFNALALAVFLVLFVAIFALPFAFLTPTIRSITKVDEPGAPEESAQYQWRLDSPRGGASVLALELPGEPLRKFSASEVMPTTRTINFMFVDTTTGETRWLFPSQDQEIVAVDRVPVDTSLSFAAAAIPQSQALAFVYDVIAGDPTKQRAGPVKYQTYIAKPDGSNLTKLMDGLDEQPKFVFLEPDKVFFLAKANGRDLTTTVSLKDFKPVMDKDITDLRPK